MKQFAEWLESQRALGMLIVRVLMGGIILWSGSLKLFVYGFSGTINSFTKMGMPVPEITGPFIMLFEFIGGIAVILGLFTRYLGVLYTIQFLVALFAVKVGMGYSAFRIDVALIAFGVLLATHGAGAISLDKKLNVEK